MELDLDSLLNAALGSEVDSPCNSVPHRTLDEILNSSDSSPSPPSSPRSYFKHTTNSQPSDVPSPVGASGYDCSLVEFLHPSPALPASVSRDPIGKPPDSASKRVSSLFVEMRTSAKPGAALAAATAASRSVPTPHAAAIKSRRAGITAPMLLKIEVNDDASVLSCSFNDDNASGVPTMESNSCGITIDDETYSPEGNYPSEFEELLSPDNFLDSTMNDIALEIESDLDLERMRGGKPSAFRITEASNDSNVAWDEAVVVGRHSDKKIAMLDLEMETSSKEIANKLDTLMVNPTPMEVIGVEDEADYIGDVSELIEERIGQLESEIVSKSVDKKLKHEIKPLEQAEEQEKKRAFTGLNWVEGAASQPMRLEGVRRGSTTFGYFDINSNNLVTKIVSSHDFQRDYGSPQVIAVHTNNIAVGTSKGIIIVIPCKYSLHNVDNPDMSQMQILRQQGDRSTTAAAVTSMCFNQMGDLLLAGYCNGLVTLCDIQKEYSVKVVTEQNPPVTHTFFLAQDFQISRQFKAVTGNSKGWFFLHYFSVIPVINRFSIKTQRLHLEEHMGTVLSASPLVLEDSGGGSWLSSQSNSYTLSNSISSMVGGVVGGEVGRKLNHDDECVVAFASHQSGVEIRLIPSLQVYARVAKPDGVREGSIPYTAWIFTLQSQSSLTDSAERMSWLAIAWDRKVIVAKIVKSELKVFGKWSLDSAAIGVIWLDIHMLVVLTATGKLYLYSKDGTAIHQTSFAVDNLGQVDLVSYHAHFLNVFGNPEKAYHNAIAVRGASVYILGPMHIITARLLPWKERIQVLRRAGDWMGALNMSMIIYDGRAHGVIDLPKTMDALRDIIMPDLVELLLSYVDEVFSYISVAYCNQVGKMVNEIGSISEGSSVQSEIKEQFTRVGGVAVEFCVHIQRTDILFDEIFSMFLRSQHKETFLELLEPYILRDMLGSLPPEIMQALVEHYNNKGWLQRVEQCILHMNISSLDFDQVVRLCWEHGLYGALIYLFNKGLDDYRAPLEELLRVSRNKENDTAVALGYRMLVYLKYCFCGLAFPPGHGEIPQSRLPSLRKELVQFLLEKADVEKCKPSTRWKGENFNFYHFLELDSEATLDVLRCAFSEEVTVGPDKKMAISKDQSNLDEIQTQLLQCIIDALFSIVDMRRFPVEDTACVDPNALSIGWPSKNDLGHVFDFISFFIASRKACVSPSMLNTMLEFLTTEICPSPSNMSHVVSTIKRREKQVLALLEAVPGSEWDASHVLQLCEKASFYQVCGSIHKARHQYLAALECFMKDQDQPVHTFIYIDEILKLHDIDYAFRSTVFSFIPELIVLSRECAFLLIIDHFPNESENILSALQTKPRSMFLYLKTVLEVYFSGTLDFSYLEKDYDDAFSRILAKQREGVELYLERVSELSKFLQSHPVSVTDSMIEHYLELLCQYERNSVLKFLEAFDSYRVEHCLRLCQEYGIIDAAAFLLERVGDVGSAISLTLSSVDEKFKALDKSLNEAPMKKASSLLSDNVLQMKEVQDLEDVLHACIVLCQRNTPRLVAEESEALWFRLLDSFCGPLDYSVADRSTFKEYNDGGMASETTFSSHKADASTMQWKIPPQHKHFHTLKKLFSHFIKEIVNGMIGYVSLPVIMSKLLSDNVSQEFGDFKTTILGMLGTYGFERRILDSAKSLIEDDTFYTMNLLKKGISHGYAPRDLVCCICNSLLMGDSTGSSVRLFICGHATHLQCEIESDSSSRGFLSGCPICLPKKPRNKSTYSDSGLVDITPSVPRKVKGTSSLLPRGEASENNTGNLTSRFDLLTHLEKDRNLIQIESIPHLRLAPPAVYHERIKKGQDLRIKEDSTSLTKLERTSKARQPRELTSSLRLPLKASIFGKEKIIKR